MPRLIDLSGYIEPGQPTYPGQETTQIWTTATHEEQGYNERREAGELTETAKRHLRAQSQGSDQNHPLVQTIKVSEHGTTHADAFTHYDSASDRSIDTLSLSRFYGDAICVDVSHVSKGRDIEIDDLQESLEEASLEIPSGGTLLIYTGHYEEHYSRNDPEKRHAYLYEFTGMSGETAQWVIDRGVTTIGVDAPSPDHARSMETQRFPVHDRCNEHNVVLLEHMANLASIAGKAFTLCAFPLKIRDGTGSPIRPVAIIEE